MSSIADTVTVILKLGAKFGDSDEPKAYRLSVVVVNQQKVTVENRPMVRVAKSGRLRLLSERIVTLSCE